MRGDRAGDLRGAIVTVPSTALLAGLIPVLVLLVFVGPPHLLLALDLLFIIFPVEWDVGNVHIDLTDVIFAAILLGFLLRPSWRRARKGQRIPYFGLWACYGVLASLAYLMAPINSEYLTDPIRIGYQLYRYAWKPILYYGLAALLITDRKRLDIVFLAIILAGDICAVEATIQGYAGLEANGPFFQKNQLGGAVIIPLFLALGGYLTSASRTRKLFYAGSILLLGRALTISASRGAFVAAVVAMGFFLVALAGTTEGRARVRRLVAPALIGLPLLLALSPDLLQRPSLKYMLTASNPDTVDNFQWRQQERWPYFWDKITTHPWFGIGTDVDPDLGEHANTPHNGYLSVAVINGLPVLGIFVVFSVLALRNGVRAFRRAGDVREGILAVSMAAALVTILCHNLVDSTITTTIPATKGFWLLTAELAIVAARPRVLARRATAPAARPARARTLSPMVSSL